MANPISREMEIFFNSTTLRGNFVTRLQGLQRLINKLKTIKDAHAKGFEAGIYEAGLLVQRESMEIVPVEYGPLRASAYTKKGGSGFGTVVWIGYTANYAIFVHEDLSAAHGFRFNMKYAAEIAAGTEVARGVNQSAKFLERPFRQLQDRILEIIGERMREFRMRETSRG